MKSRGWTNMQHLLSNPLHRKMRAEAEDLGYVFQPQASNGSWYCIAPDGTSRVSCSLVDALEDWHRRVKFGLYLDVNNYRINQGVGEIDRDNVDALLDAGRIETRVAKARWWKIRRNGVTKRWKTDASRIEIPWKAGLHVYGKITEKDFV